jgi:transcriptional regulator with XRE-family HTH domain
MSAAVDHDLSDEQSRAIAERVREELARRRMSRESLAAEARISLSTLEKALSGRRPFTLATTVRLEEALKLPLRRSRPAPAAQGAAFAPDALGSYSRPSVAWLEGEYVTVRPSFDQKGALYAYRTSIAWDEAASCLTFHEASRLDVAFTQTGAVSLPNQSGHIYLITNHHGQYRLVLLGRPAIGGELYGLITTLQAGLGSQLFPVSAPIAYLPARLAGDEPALGMIEPEHPQHPGYRRHLERTLSQSYARFFADPA